MPMRTTYTIIEALVAWFDIIFILWFIFISNFCFLF